MNEHRIVAKQKNVFVILGMARSGTSVIARSLKAIGIDLGERLTPKEKCRWNPKGSWEDRDIVFNINEKVFAFFNYSWHSVKLLDSACQANGALQDLKKIAAGILQQRFAITDYWGFKDPRTVKLLSFWQSVFNKLEIVDHYVVALRNPLSCAQSYQKLTGKDIEHGLLLWLGHLLAAVDGTHGKKRVLVSYDLMMQDPLLQLDRIKKNLDIPELTDDNDIKMYANEFLDKNLYHYTHDSADLKSHPATAVSPLCINMYDLLLKVARDEFTLDDERFITAWQEIKNEFEKAAPIYNYIDTLLRRNYLAEKYIYSLHKSRLWRLISPLRKIDNVLRDRRRRLKQKRLKVND